MWNNCKDNKEPNWEEFIGLEIAACQEVMVEDQHGDEIDSFWEVVYHSTYSPDRPVIFTLYGISNDMEVQALHDCKTAEQVSVLAGNILTLNPGFLLRDRLFNMEVR